MKNKYNFYIIGEDQLNWSTDQDKKNVKNFLKINHINATHNVLNSTHIFLIYYDLYFSEKYFWLRKLKPLLNFKTIAMVTHDIRNYEWRINKYKNYFDIWVSPSKRIYNFLTNRGLKVAYLPFYVEKKVFFCVNKSKRELCDELNIDYNKIRNKIIIGTFQRDSLNTLMEPKWQKDPDLLIKILKNLPKDIFILMIAGPRRHYLINECEKNNIPYVYFGNYSYIKKKKDDINANNHPIKTINLLYNLSDIYIVSSKSEGGPKAIMEASLTRTLIFSTDVGLAKDFLHKDLIYTEESFEDIINSVINFKSIQKKIEQYINYNYHNVLKVLQEENYKKLYSQFLF